MANKKGFEYPFIFIFSYCSSHKKRTTEREKAQKWCPTHTHPSPLYPAGTLVPTERDETVPALPQEKNVLSQSSPEPARAAYPPSSSHQPSTHACTRRVAASAPGTNAADARSQALRPIGGSSTPVPPGSLSFSCAATAEAFTSTVWTLKCCFTLKMSKTYVAWTAHATRAAYSCVAFGLAGNSDGAAPTAAAATVGRSRAAATASSSALSTPPRGTLLSSVATNTATRSSSSSLPSALRPSHAAAAASAPPPPPVSRRESAAARRTEAGRRDASSSPQQSRRETAAPPNTNGTGTALTGR
eukprot:Rhum_TRINITY_DN14380_c7_g1::Rhum_TRINITY_DN14380_c7_g1_i1::g.84455::m.84455